MKAKVTINDIAQQTGVSPSTVSLVLNNKPGVSQETRARVLEAASQLEYPIRTASATGTSSSLTTIGMMVKTEPDLPPQANPFYSKVILGIEDVCRKNSINLLFSTLPVDDQNRPLEYPNLLDNQLVDGLLMIGTFIDETVTFFSDKKSIPIVLVDGYSDTLSFDTVVSDNFRASYRAVEYLIAKGHRYIGLAGGESNSYPSLRERRNGYSRALKENGLRESFVANFNINKTSGIEEITTLLQEHPQITALFCVNDNVGSAAVRAVEELGKRVPDNISIIGFDDTYVAALTHPPMTTNHVDTLAMGRAAVHLLSLRMDNPESARMTFVIHTSLVERDSVCFPAPGSSAS
jgi:DNA-binding LacI/PurR family transcriptional regulator